MMLLLLLLFATQSAVTGESALSAGMRPDVKSNSLSANDLRLRMRSANGDTYMERL